MVGVEWVPSSVWRRVGVGLRKSKSMLFLFFLCVFVLCVEKEGGGGGELLCGWEGVL